MLQEMSSLTFTFRMCDYLPRGYVCNRSGRLIAKDIPLIGCTGEMVPINSVGYSQHETSEAAIPNCLFCQTYSSNWQEAAFIKPLLQVRQVRLHIFRDVFRKVEVPWEISPRRARCLGNLGS